MTIFSFTPLILILHSLFIFLFKRWLGPISTFYATLCCFFFTIITLLVDLCKLLLNGQYYYIDFGRWFFCLDLVDSHLVFCMDTLSIICSILVLFLTMFAIYFGVEYMYREAFINRLLYLLNMFATSVIFLFFCFDFFLILFSWECIGLFSLLLVNFYSSRIYTIKATLKTFVFSRISDLFMFLTFVMSVSIFNTTDLSLIFVQSPFLLFHYIYFGNYSLHFLTIYSFCLALAGSIKSAQFFFHVWLPDAMEAPTPASALIHSSTLVVAGIFLIIRFSVIFEFTFFTNYFLLILGGITLVFGAITATFQSDIKKLVAYSTISQIGYLTCGCGLGCYEEVLLYLIIHALNKAFLFILVGYIVHFFSGNTDMRQMGGSYLYSFDIAVFMFILGFNLSGLPYSAGFLGKEFLLFQIFRDDFICYYIQGCWLISFFFTPIYMFLLTFIVQFGIKKSFFNNYSSNWYFSNKINNTVLSFYSTKYICRTKYFQSAIISKLTSYVLFTFWLIFMFIGEHTFYLIFNYSSLSDTILSNSFVSIKQHTPYFLTFYNYKTLSYLELYIYLLLIYSILFILNFNYKTTVNFNKKLFLTILLPLLIFFI